MKRRPGVATSLALAAALLLPCVLRAEERPVLDVQLLSRAPTLEDFLDMRPPDDLADQLAHATGFVQQKPEDGNPASQKTDVYLGYDAKNIYVIFVAFDDEPELMRAHVNRREDVFGDETVEVQFDTFNDERRAFSFLTNPFGVQWDAIWTEGLEFDSSWDTVWKSDGRLTDRGYVVWMAIPFESLRFSREQEQTWGIVLVRDIPRNNEVSFWPRVTNRIVGRLNQEATLRGLRGISPGRNLQLIPYATGRRFRTLREDASGFESESFDPDAGLDAKWVIADRLALDLTANPDFSQVESDQAQVTVNERFEVFFPEKRPFFLENAAVYETPFNLLFTRRIDEPRGGARLTGKLGRFTLGTLLVDDETPGREVASDSRFNGDVARFGVLRLSHDVGDQSNVGMMYTEHEFGGRRNRVGGIDGRQKLGDNWDVRYQAVFSNTRIVEETDDTRRVSDEAYNLAVNRSGRKLKIHMHYEEVGPDFITDVGFVRRQDIRDLHTNWDYRFRPENRRLVAWGPSLRLARVADHRGTRLDWRVNPQMEWEFRRQTSTGFFLSRGRDRLRPEDLPSSVPDADRVTVDFPQHEQGVFFSTRFVSALTAGITLAEARTFNFNPPGEDLPGPADSVRAELNATLRPLPRLLWQTTWLYRRLNQRDGPRILTNQILRSRISWQFDRRLSLRVIVRYDSLSPTTRSSLDRLRNVNGDVLVSYLVNPWTALYVGYNGNYRHDPTMPMLDDGYTRDSQEVFVKFSYLIRP